MSGQEQPTTSWLHLVERFCRRARTAPLSLLYDSPVTNAQQERAALAALLDETGPDSPTLCEGWQTRDLAAHLVLRERRPDAAAGVVGGPLAGHTARVQRQFLDRYSYADLVALFRSGPPK